MARFLETPYKILTMKKTIVTSLLFLSFALSSVFAQKLGHVSLDSLISLMPEYKTAKDKSEGKLKSLESFLMNLKNEYDMKDRKSTRLNSSHSQQSRMPSSA